ncbi:MAG: BrnT family toxin [Gammaproteobacteria bacterium]
MDLWDCQVREPSVQDRGFFGRFIGPRRPDPGRFGLSGECRPKGWDPEKERINSAKHGINFTEAVTVFADPLELTIADPDHSEAEFRLVSIGMSSGGRLVVVGYTERGERMRIITARLASAREHKQYESGT